MLFDPEEMITPLPSGVKRRAKARKRKSVRKRKVTPKYREMIVRSLKALKEKNGSTTGAIAKYIEARYRKRNDYVLNHVITWLVGKRVLSRSKGRVKLTGRKLTLKQQGKKGRSAAKRRRKSVAGRKRRRRRRR